MDTPKPAKDPWESLARQDGKVTYYLLADLARAGFCHISNPAHEGQQHKPQQSSLVVKEGAIPETPFWTLLDKRRITTWSGYKEDSGTTEWVWRMWIFTDEDAFLRVLRAYYEYLARPDREKSYDDLFIGFDCSGRIVPKASITLGSAPRAT